MITQILQLFDLLTFKGVHLLVLLFLASTCATLLYTLRARKFRNRYTQEVRAKTSAIVPTYRERVDVLARVLEALRPQVDQLIVVADEPDAETKKLVKAVATDYVFNKDKVGKRAALNQGLVKALHNIVVLVDSDSIVGEGAVKELIKPFADSEVGVVQGKPVVLKQEGNTLSQLFSRINEKGRDFMCRTLNGNLIVADGRLNAIRAGLFSWFAEECVTDTYMGKKIITGDDRQRTRLVHREGFKSVYQPSAVTYTFAQPSFKLYLKQQVRWIRSGYIYFGKDVRERNLPSKLYLLRGIHYYIAPLAFMVAVLGDLLFLPPVSVVVPWYSIPFTLVVGLSLLTLTRQMVMFGVKNVEYRWVPLVGLYGLFVSFPMMLYGLVTTRKACSSWETR